MYPFDYVPFLDPTVLGPPVAAVFGRRRGAPLAVGRLHTPLLWYLPDASFDRLGVARSRPLAPASAVPVAGEAPGSMRRPSMDRSSCQSSRCTSGP